MNESPQCTDCKFFKLLIGEYRLGYGICRHQEVRDTHTDALEWKDFPEICTDDGPCTGFEKPGLIQGTVRRVLRKMNYER